MADATGWRRAGLSDKERTLQSDATVVGRLLSTSVRTGVSKVELRRNTLRFHLSYGRNSVYFKNFHREMRLLIHIVPSLRRKLPPYSSDATAPECDGP